MLVGLCQDVPPRKGCKNTAISEHRMGTPVIASWDTLRSLLQSARKECSVFTPFYSRGGLDHLSDSLKNSVEITIWTRLSLRDWANGVCDPHALSAMLVKRKTPSPIKLYTNHHLHAKAYFADHSAALVGSANLTGGGFKTNVELMVQLTGEETKTALSILTVATTACARLVSSDELAAWVTKHEKLIERLSGKVEKDLSELDLAQEESGIGGKDVVVIEPTEDWLDRFVQWLGNNRKLPGAVHLLDLHTDKVIQRQQGHVKQCFSGAFRFLQEQPSLLQQLADAAGGVGGMITLEGDLLREWKSHLKAHANASNDLYSYDTLRRILPINGGGTHKGGGGAGTTLRRIFPLVARFMTQQGHQLKRKV